MEITTETKQAIEITEKKVLSYCLWIIVDNDDYLGCKKVKPEHLRIYRKDYKKGSIDVTIFCDTARHRSEFRIDEVFETKQEAMDELIKRYYKNS